MDCKRQQDWHGAFWLAPTRLPAEIRRRFWFLRSTRSADGALAAALPTFSQRRLVVWRGAWYFERVSPRQKECHHGRAEIDSDRGRRLRTLRRHSRRAGDRGAQSYAGPRR